MAKSKTNHVKPTQEELKAQELEAIAEAEKLQDVPEEEPVVDEPETPEETIEEPEVDTPEVETPEPQQDLKEKLSASARENQRIYAKNRVMNKALSDVEDMPEPTEEELAKEYQDWDVMSDIEKTFAKETIVSKRWRQTISEAKKQAEKIEKWNDSVDEYLDDPTTLTKLPELEGKTEQFRAFALKEENNSVPLNILTSAFLHENSSGRTPNKGRMFERGSGGPNDRPQPKDGTITLEEARKLREKDYAKYKEYLIAGKIKSDF